MEKEISDAKIKFALDAEKNNLSNRMAIIQKGTQEELDLKIKMLDLEREEEMNTAEKSGEDVFLIDESIRKKDRACWKNSHPNRFSKLLIMRQPNRLCVTGSSRQIY